MSRLVAIMLTLAASAVIPFASAQNSSPGVYEMRIYWSPEGRLDDLHARFRDHTLKLFEKHGMTNVGYWTPVENKENKLIYVLSYPTVEARQAAWKAFQADAEWAKVKKETEAKGPIVSKVQSYLMQATDYSPIPKPGSAGERVFELREYVATKGNLDHLNARFRDHTVKLFEKHGMTNLAYWTPTAGQKGAPENFLVYILAHKSQDAAKQSFDAFRQDPNWIAARKASEEKAGGSLTEPKGGVKSTFMKATDYSPIK
ncbi:MAG: NIPSNAP family protein [Gemmataceae bacterium]|nr:NIPSNAP family protein [Gemmataceae bacterium]